MGSRRSLSHGHCADPDFPAEFQCHAGRQKCLCLHGGDWERRSAGMGRHDSAGTARTGWQVKFERRQGVDALPGRTGPVSIRCVKWPTRLGRNVSFRFAAPTFSMTVREGKLSLQDLAIGDWGAGVTRLRSSLFVKTEVRAMSCEAGRSWIVINSGPRL